MKRGFWVVLALVASLFCVSYISAKTTLEVAIYPDLDKGYAVAISNFMKANPDVEIALKVSGWGDHHNALTAALAAGEGIPDVTAVDVGFIGQLGAGGGFDNLLKAPYNAGKYQKDIIAYAWAQGSVSKTELIGLPVDIGPGVAFYRKDILEKAKIDINTIKSMDDLFEVGKKVTKDLNGDGKLEQWLVADVGDIFQIISKSDKTRFFDEKGKPVINRPLIKEAMKITKKFSDAGLGAKINQWTAEWYAALDAQVGGVVYTPSGAWLLGHLKNWMAPHQAGNYRAANLPSLKKGGQPLYASWGGSFLAVPTKSKNKELAWKFVEFMCTRTDNQIEAFKATAAFPSYIPALKDPSLSEGVPYLGGQKARILFAEIAKKVPTVYINEKDSIAQTILNAALQKVINEGADIDKTVEAAQKELIEQIKE